MKTQIKSVLGAIIFEAECNTIKEAVEKAVKTKTSLTGADLTGADLKGADLKWANLSVADLTGADLKGADLKGANLKGADLTGANLKGADLTGANLKGADLTGANLKGADLKGANLKGADLTGADLTGADLYGADLTGIKNIPFIPFACPSDGAFIGWKKVKNKLVKLEIPEDARRSSATSNKCRCDKATVVSITDIDGSNPISEIVNDLRAHKVVYKVGEMVYPDSFDEDRWSECSHGIHFFSNRQDAINY